MLQKQKQENKNSAARGITLIETVLYISLLTVLLALTLPLFLDVRAWQSKQEGVADTIGEYLFIQAKIKNLVQERGARIVSPEIGEYAPRLVIDLENDGRVTFELSETDELDRKKLFMDFLERRNMLSNPYSLTSTSSAVDQIAFYHSRFENNGVDGIETVQFSISINGINFGTTTTVVSNN